jgi:hypothetical protein
VGSPLTDDRDATRKQGSLRFTHKEAVDEESVHFSWGVLIYYLLYTWS